MTRCARVMLSRRLVPILLTAGLLLAATVSSSEGPTSRVIKPQPIGAAKRLAGKLVGTRDVDAPEAELPLDGLVPAGVRAPAPIAKPRGLSSDTRRQPAQPIPVDETESRVRSRAACPVGQKLGQDGTCVTEVTFFGQENISLENAIAGCVRNGQVIATADQVILAWQKLAFQAYAFGRIADGRMAVPVQRDFPNFQRGPNIGANGGNQGYFCAMPPAPWGVNASPNPVSTGVNGRNLKKVTFGGSSAAFAETTPGLWTEFGGNGIAFNTFRETNRDDWSVYLHDAGRNIAIQLDVNRKMIKLGQNGAPRSDWMPITSVASTIVPDPPPNPATASGTAPAPSPVPPSMPSSTPAQDAISAQRRYEERKNRETMAYSILQQQAEDFQRLRKERMERAKEEQIAATKIRGPSPLGAINLLEGLHVDAGAELYQSDILQIDHQVYQDGNPKRGLFYFLPKRYDLGWSAENQYAMTVIYGLAEDKVEDGEVYMATRLYSGVDGRELSVARKLLVAYIRRHAREGIIPFKELRPFPLEATSDISLFGGANNDFAIPSDKISVQGVSGLLGVLDVSWATDVKRLLNVESLLRTDAGIHGSITFHAAGAEDFSQAVPLEISVSAPQTFGSIPFDRSARWSNQTLYPLKLKHLHVLVLSPTDRGTVRKHDPIVYSWDLGGEAVAPGTSVDWDASLVPESIEQSALRMWVTYSVDSDCTACDDAVFSEKFIPPLPETRPVVFTSADIFETTDAYRVAVHLRSPFLDPQRSTVNYQPAVVIEEDGVEVPIAKLYLKDREFTGDGVSEPLYQYRLVVSMRDGSKLESTEWLSSRDLDHLIGSSTLANIIGQTPQVNSGAGSE